MPIPDESAPLDSAARLLSDAVFQRLSAAIIDGTLQPGEVLKDADLQRWMGVSRTPIRDALFRLTVVGLIEMSPSRFTRVTSVDPALVDETLEYTGYQAGIAVRMAVERMDDTARAEALDLLDGMISASERDDTEQLYATSRRFVGFITAQTRNRVFIRMMQEAGVAMERNLRVARPLLQDSQVRTALYRRMREAIVHRDAEYAESSFRRQHGLDGAQP